MRNKQGEKKTTGETSNKDQRKESSKNDAKKAGDPKKPTPKIEISRWVIVTKDQKYIPIESARQGSKVKIELGILYPKEAIGKNLDITILDKENEKVGNTTLTVEDNKSYSREEFEITTKMIDKELHIEIKQSDPFVEDFIEKKNLLTIESGIRVYPFRYGIHCFITDPNKNNSKYTLKKDEEKVNDNSTVTAPDHLYPMPLRFGWLYVYSETARDIYELKYDEENITFKETNKTSGRKVKAGSGYLIVSETDKIALFYSEVQLTPEAIGVLKEKRDDFMHKLDLQSFDSESRAISVKDMAVYHQISGIGKYSESRLNNLVKEAKYNYDKPEGKKDLFFVVDDPVGVAKQMEWYLQDKHLDHEAFIRSIRTGVSFSTIKKKMFETKILEKNEIIISDSTLLGNSSDLEHYAAIHNLGMMMYYRLYVNDNDVEDIKDEQIRERYRDDLDKARKVTKKEFLEQILAVERRKSIRKHIDKYRENLVINLKSDSFEKYCGFFAQLKPPTDSNQEEAFNKMLLEVKKLVMDLCCTLSILPHTKDQHIDGEKKDIYCFGTLIQKAYKDPGEEYLKNISKKRNQVGKLLYKELDMIALFSDYSEGTKSSANIDTLFDFLHSTYVTFRNDIFDNEILENNSKVGNESACKRDKEVTDALEKQVGNKGTGIKSKIQEQIKLAKNSIVEPIKKIVNKEDSFFSRSAASIKSNRFIEYISNHKGFQSVMSGIYIYSLFSSIQEKDIKEKIKFGANVGALGTTFLEGFAKKNIKKNTLLLKKFDVAFKVFSVIGTGVDIYDSWIKAYGRLMKNNNAAAAFYGLSVVAYATSAILVFAQGAAFGVLGIIVSLAAIVFTIIAEWLTDTAMESFIKNSIFCSNNECNINFNKIDTSKNPISVTEKLKKEKLGNYKFMLEEYSMCLSHIPHITLESYSADFDVKFEKNNRPSPDMSSVFYLRYRIDLRYYAYSIKVDNLITYVSNEETKVSYTENNNDYYTKQQYESLEDNVFFRSQAIWVNGLSGAPRRVYITTCITFQCDGSKTLPYSKNNMSQYLFLRHKITMVRDAKNKYTVQLLKTKIASSLEEFNKAD
ncbi:MAG: hypothetical protein FWF70_08235 [Bacteroidetes bacterium]|nr:hypothetical protein [Bacteroidota bacterium]MCL1968240.1 hypothetical protein [Bacteroidota bacterium]